MYYKQKKPSGEVKVTLGADRKERLKRFRARRLLACQEIKSFELAILILIDEALDAEEIEK